MALQTLPLYGTVHSFSRVWTKTNLSEGGILFNWFRKISYNHVPESVKKKLSTREESKPCMHARLPSDQRKRSEADDNGVGEVHFLQQLYNLSIVEHYSLSRTIRIVEEHDYLLGPRRLFFQELPAWLDSYMELLWHMEGLIEACSHESCPRSRGSKKKWTDYNIERRWNQQPHYVPK